MPKHQEKSRATQRHRGEKRRRRWPWVVGAIVLLGLLLGIAGAVIATSALSARDHLQAAKSNLSRVSDLYKAGDRDGAKAQYVSARNEASAASDDVSGWLWSAGQVTPWAGSNLTAVRTVADQTAGVLTDAQPLAEAAFALNPDELVHDGALDLDSLTSLIGQLDPLDARLEDAKQALDAVNTDGLVSQVADGVTQLRDQVDSLQPGVQRAADLGQYLPTLLGSDGPKNYLLLFQNNAEVRALGGNPASLMLLTVDNGRLEISDQKSSGDFSNGRATPIADINEDTYSVFISNVARYEMDMTGLPDLPQVATLAQAWWKDAGGTQQIDGVMTFDPVGLSYLLRATGPVTLQNGDVLTSDNVVQAVLSDVYAKYSLPAAQDAYFAAAAASVFDALTDQPVDAQKLVEALGQSVDERRLLFWSADENVQNALSDNSDLQGVIPEDGTGADDTTSVGVYLWDTTGSKIDYHVRNDNDLVKKVCQSSGTTTYSVDISLTSTITPEEAQQLPAYVLPDGPKAAQRFGTDIYVFGPQGSTFAGMEVISGGLDQGVRQEGATLGRPAVRIGTQMAFGTTTTVRVTFTAPTAANDLSTLNLLTTPMVQPVGAKASTTDECE